MCVCVYRVRCACVALCCNVLQCVAVCCSVLPCVYREIYVEPGSLSTAQPVIIYTYIHMYIYKYICTYICVCVCVCVCVCRNTCREPESAP